MKQISNKTLSVDWCVACESNQLIPFFYLPTLPANVCHTPSTYAEAINSAHGIIALVYCRQCQHVFNQAFDASLVRYEPGYEAGLQHSPVFRAFMESLANRLISQFDLRDKALIELGAGSGWFLQQLCERGNNRGLGFDPSTPVQGILPTRAGRVELERRYFDEDCCGRFQDWEADFVCCLSVFEHVPEPLQFLRRLRRFVGDRSVNLYLEIFNAERALRNREIWSILYEQCNYFTDASLANILSQSGFCVTELGQCYQGDQYLYAEATTDFLPGTKQQRAAERPAEATDLQQDLPAYLREFSNYFQEHLAGWSQRLKTFRDRGARVVFWGSGGKGVSFLNLLESQGLIEYVAEINPAKHGRFIPGSGQRIVAPEFLREYRPDVIIVSNALYLDEIKQQSQALQLESEFYVA